MPELHALLPSSFHVVVTSRGDTVGGAVGGA